MAISVPSPPSIVSSPAPPVTVSSPRPRLIVSLPALPKTVSVVAREIPSPPVLMTSFNAPPFTVVVPYSPPWWLPSVKSISNQKIYNKFFDINYEKSITEKLSEKELDILSSDIVISSATIEHVGNDYNKIMMIKNMSLLAKQYFVITTPNRFYPIDFHTKLPFIHFLPKNIHRAILKLIGMKFFSKEENLDLISYKQLKILLKNVENFQIQIKRIKFFGLTSNFIVIAKKVL